MSPLDYAISSCHRLRSMLQDKAEGKMVPAILLTHELRLLTERIERLVEPQEDDVFDLISIDPNEDGA